MKNKLPRFTLNEVLALVAGWDCDHDKKWLRKQFGRRKITARDILNIPAKELELYKIPFLKTPTMRRLWGAYCLIPSNSKLQHVWDEWLTNHPKSVYKQKETNFVRKLLDRYEQGEI